MTFGWKAALGAAMGLATGVAAAPVFAGEATFLCNAPAGHICQVQINTGAGPIAFALPAHEKKRVAGVTPHADKYCVCDPGLNSENDAGKDAFAAAWPVTR